MRSLAAAAVIAGVPVAALVVLALAGWAPIGPVLLAIGMTLLAAWLLAMRWSCDVNALSDSLRQVDTDDAARLVRVPLLPGMQRLGREVDRLARRVAARTG